MELDTVDDNFRWSCFFTLVFLCPTCSITNDSVGNCIPHSSVSMQQDAHACASTKALKVSLQVQACEIAYEQWKQLTFFFPCYTSNWVYVVYWSSYKKKLRCLKYLCCYLCFYVHSQLWYALALFCPIKPHVFFLRCKPDGVYVQDSAVEVLATVWLHIDDVFKGGTVVARQVMNLFSLFPTKNN